VFSAADMIVCSEGSGDMFAQINIENIENQNQIIGKFFKKEFRVNYNKKLTGKIKLYISEKNTLRNISGLVAIYKRELQ
jgi:isocitrate dehydrogenase